MRLSEKGLKELLEKTASKASKTKKELKKVLDTLEEPKAKTKSSFKYSDIIKSINDCEIKYYYDKEENSFSFLLEDVRLVTLNEMLAHLQRQGLKNALFNYKKAIHNKLASFYQSLPKKDRVIFEGKVELTLYRSGVRLIDADSMPASFKYYIDGLRNCGMIKDDNPNFVQEIKILQTKSPTRSCGIKIRALKEHEYNNEISVDITKLWNLK